MDENKIIAFVGMPGAGKSEAAAYLQEKSIPFVRFGSLTDEGLKELGLEINPENEKMLREKYRDELGMAAYAIKAKPKIEELLKKSKIIGIDGLYSWEEYTYLKDVFPNLVLVHIFASPEVRYSRLEKRPVRPIPFGVSRERDFSEIERLNKGGPIAIADYLIKNEGDMDEMNIEIDKMLDIYK